MRRRRPLARAAVVGGAAYYAGKSAQRGSDREADQEARLQELESQQYQQQPQYAPPPPPAPAPAAAGGMTDEKIEQLKQLADLHTQGVLTDEEFNMQKQRILAS